MSSLITLLGTNFQPEICRWTNSYRVLHFEQHKLNESSWHKFNRSCALVGLILIGSTFPIRSFRVNTCISSPMQRGNVGAND